MSPSSRQTEARDRPDAGREPGGDAAPADATAARPLFDPAFLQRLERLTLRLRKLFRSTGRGDRRSRRRGASPEFAEHRNYHPGDDLRRIDWAAYARLEQLFLKEHAAEQDLAVHLLLDRSGSMGFADKFDQARRLAAAFLYIALCSGDRVRVQDFQAGRVGPRRGPWRGKRAFPKLLAALGEMQPEGETGLDDAVRRFCARAPAPGIVLVVSDLLEPSGAEEALKRLQYGPWQPTVLHVLAPGELDPGADPAFAGGDIELADIEAAADAEEPGLAMTLDGTALRLYREKLEAWLHQTEAFCRKHGIAYTLARSDASLEELVLHDMTRAGIVG